MFGVFSDVHQDGGNFDHILPAFVRVRSQTVLTRAYRVWNTLAGKAQLHQVQGQEHRSRKYVYAGAELHRRFKLQTASWKHQRTAKQNCYNDTSGKDIYRLGGVQEIQK